MPNTLYIYYTYNENDIISTEFTKRSSFSGYINNFHELKHIEKFTKTIRGVADCRGLY